MQCAKCFLSPSDAPVSALAISSVLTQHFCPLHISFCLNPPLPFQSREWEEEEEEWRSVGRQRFSPFQQSGAWSTWFSVPHEWASLAFQSSNMILRKTQTLYWSTYKNSQIYQLSIISKKSWIMEKAVTFSFVLVWPAYIDWSPHPSHLVMRLLSHCFLSVIGCAMFLQCFEKTTP